MTSIFNWSGLRALPLVRQSEAGECGLACLAMVAGYHGYDVDLASLRRRFPTSLKGVSLRSISEIGAAIGLGGRALRCEPEDLRYVRAPAILHWRLNHFVVLHRVDDKSITVYDPALGVRKISFEEASQSFTGLLLELSPTATFEKRRERQTLRLGSLVRLGPDSVPAILQALLLAFVIEGLTLAMPFYMQIVIDESILKGDIGLLVALAVGFGIAVVFNVVATALRNLSLQFLGSVLSFDMEARLFHHLLRLPLDWFHKRHVGDVQSRFQAIAPIQQFVTGGALAAVMDGILSIFIAFMMLYYDARLSLVVFVALGFYVAIRLSILELSRRLAGDYLICDAREQTRFLETLRAAQTIKLGGAETRREAMQRNAMAATTNASIKNNNLVVAYAAVNQLIVGLSDIIVIYFGALAVLQTPPALTVGMLTAFIAYKGQFIARFTALTENLVTWRLLDVQLERLGDIALSPREPSRLEGRDAAIEGGLQLQNIRFRYGMGDRETLRGVNLSIKEGEFVAICGPSGGGKSTLLKVVAGLYQPSAGEVRVDDLPLSRWSAPALRRQIAMVAQDDQLLQGSIAENIASFEEEINMDRIIECAQLAAIHRDIEGMPMGYQSLVGDMGSTLSGGQKQRVLIARALYRAPKILLLDESTSHLDAPTEVAITQALANLRITRIVVAHRAETLRAADVRLQLQNGVLAPLSDIAEIAPPASSALGPS